MMVENCELETKVGFGNKERIFAISNKNQYDLLDYYLNPNTIFNAIE